MFIGFYETKMRSCRQGVVVESCFYHSCVVVVSDACQTSVCNVCSSHYQAQTDYLHANPSPSENAHFLEVWEKSAYNNNRCIRQKFPSPSHYMEFISHSYVK